MIKRKTCRIEGCTEPRYIRSSMALCHEHYLAHFRTIVAGRKLLDARANVRKAA